MKQIVTWTAKILVVIAIFMSSSWMFASVAATLSEADTILNAEISELSAEEDTLNFAKFQQAEYDMLCLVAHFEGVKVNAYWDPHGRVYTIGIGNTVRPDGTKVKYGDRIKDKDELFEYFKAHVEAYIWPDMQKYLPMSEMSVQEIASLGSLFYNCGSGILRNKDGLPSHLSDVIYSYFCYKAQSDTVVNVIDDEDSTVYTVDSRKAVDYCKRELTRLMNLKVYSGGKKLNVLVKRRLLEEKIFFGEIIMDNKGEFALENSVNFAEQPLGAAYSIPIRDFNDVTLVCDSINNCPYGRNLQDSIEYAFTRPVRQAPYKKTAKRRIRR